MTSLHLLKAQTLQTTNGSARMVDATKGLEGKKISNRMSRRTWATDNSNATIATSALFEDTT
jgi:hypothetical protein